PKAMKVMKSRKHSPKTQSKKAAQLTYSSVLSDMFRSAWRASGYAFAAGAGIWLPRAEAATLISLDATTGYNTSGPLATWTNTGTAVGDFTVPVGSATPIATNVDKVACILFTGTNAAAGQGAGMSYVGPVAPIAVCSNNPRTFEAWIWDPKPEAGKVVLTW